MLRRSGPIRPLIAIAIVVVAALFGASARADDRTADAHFRRGVALFDEGNYAGAAVEFRTAYEMAPDFRVLYNIGQANQRAHRYSVARAAFQRYLADGGERVPADRRPRVEATIAELDKMVGRVRITVDVSGARVLVDGEVVGTSPLADPVVCDPGRRTVRAEKDGAAAEATVEVVATGSEASIAVKLAQSQAPPAKETPPTITPPVEPPRERSLVGPIILGSGAAVTVGALVLDFVVVRSKLEDFEELRDRDDPGAGDARSSVQTFQTATLVTYIVGAALVGAGAVITFWPKRTSTTSSALTGGVRF